MRSQRVISIVRCHAEGEVGDVIVGGVLPPPGRTMFERMSAMQRDQDGLRRLLLPFAAIKLIDMALTAMFTL